MAEGYILNHLSGVLLIRKLWLGLERWLSSQEYLEAFVEHAGSVLSTHVGDSHLPETLISGGLTPFSGLCGHLHTCGTYTCAQVPTHAQKQKKKRKFWLL